MKKTFITLVSLAILLVACTPKEKGLVKQVDGPLSYTLPDTMEVQRQQVKDPLAPGFNESLNSACQEVEKDYAVAEEYAFMADIEKIKSQGSDPKDFAWRVLVFPNPSQKGLAEVDQDFTMCTSGMNWSPLAVSEDYIVVNMLCEGVMLGCGTAQDAMRESIKLTSKE